MTPFRIEPTEAQASSAVRGLELDIGDKVPEASSGFEGIFAQALSDVSEMRHKADLKVQALASGAEDDLHGTMIAAKEAEIGTRLVGTIRNKLIDAFQELWRTSV